MFVSCILQGRAVCLTNFGKVCLHVPEVDCPLRSAVKGKAEKNFPSVISSIQDSTGILGCLFVCLPSRYKKI